jgi:hypothetical protein
MKVVFGFSRPKKELPLSVLIRAVEKRPFSHVYVRFQEPSGVEMVFQASGLEVNLITYDHFKQFEQVIEEYELDGTGCDLAIWEFVLGHLGVKYSVMQLVYIAIRKLTGFKTGHNGASEVVCSELAARLCDYMGVESSMDPDYVTPSDFQKFCQNCNRMRRIS